MARRRTLGYVQNEWTCPNCATRNKGGVKTCENCGAPQPENVQFELPTVVDVFWQTSVPVQKIQAVDYNNEPGSPRSGAYDVSCHDESRDVCEQRIIDQGNGYSEVVEECHTETQQYCSYTVDEWKTIQTYTLDGSNLQPIYDSPSVSSGQRLGDRSEEFTITFSTENGEETYSPATISEFQQFTIGSTWTLKMNALGGVVSVEP